MLRLSAGSAPTPLTTGMPTSITPVKPISSLSERWTVFLDVLPFSHLPVRLLYLAAPACSPPLQRVKGSVQTTQHVVVVGGGAGGVELILAVRARLHRVCPSALIIS